MHQILYYVRTNNIQYIFRKIDREAYYIIDTFIITIVLDLRAH